MSKTYRKVKGRCYMVLSRKQVKRMLERIGTRNGEITCGVFEVELVKDTRGQYQANIWI
jgi:hypothetical protein